MAFPPAQAPTSWWLSLASRLGRVALVCLVLENFLLLFAPLAFLLSLPSNARLSTGASGASPLPVFTDPSFLLTLADLFAVIGFTILAPVLFLILVGLARSKRRMPLDALLLGGTLACVVAVIPVELYARARAVGTVASLDAVAATGGWSLASGLILVASLLYLFLTMRVEAGAPPLKFSCYKWPVYGAVNVFGSLAIAAYFQGLAAGNPSLDALTLGLVVKMTLVPVLGVLAYRDLLDRFPNWARLPVAGVPVYVPPAVPAARPRPRIHMPRRVHAPARPIPPPPSPENTMRLPPPPTD